MLCDTSRDAKFQRTVRTWLAKSDYADTHWFTCPIPSAGLADAPRDQQLFAVNEILCRIYNRLRERLTTDYVWTLEDAIVSFRLLKIGGLQIFDDYQFQPGALVHPPRPAIDAFLLLWSDCLDILHQDAQVIVRKTREPLQPPQTYVE